MSARCVLAVDVGGTSLKGAVVDEHGTTVALRDRASDAGGLRVEENLLTLLADLAAAAHDVGTAPLAVGVGTPGTVAEETGTIVYASNLGWRDFPLRRVLEDATGLPVAVGHDARAAGRAEHLASGTTGSFAFVPIGTGLAAALVLDGVAISGATGAAGEFGHVIVEPEGEDCPCGQRGCVEAYAAGAAIVRRYRARGGVQATTTAHVAGRLGMDADADAVWADAVRALALGLQGITMLFDPAEIVIGGGVSRAGRALLDPLEVALRDRLAWRAPPRLSTARWGSEAGRVGAALLAFERIGVHPAFTPPL